MPIDNGPVVAIRETFDSAYQRLYPQLVRLAYLLVDTVEHAEEAVQDSFAKAYPKWGRVEHPDTYLRTAVVNTCRRVQRRLINAKPGPSASDSACRCAPTSPPTSSDSSPPPA